MKIFSTILTFSIVGSFLIGALILMIEVSRAEDKSFSDWGEE